MPASDPTLMSGMSNVLDPASSALLYDGFVSADVEYPALFMVGTGATRTIEKKSILPPGQMQTRVDAADIPTSPLEEGNNVTYTMGEEVIGYEVGAGTWDFLQDTPEIGDFYRQIGLVPQRAINRACMLVIAGGYTTNGPDGQPLYSNSHPRGDGSGNLVDNLGTTGFDIDALETTYTAGLQMVSPDGMPAPVRWNCLVVPVELHIAALQAIEAIGRHDAADTFAGHTPNVVGRWYTTLVTTAEYTDANDWQVFDLAGWRGNVLFKVPPYFWSFVDNRSGNYVVNGRQHYAVGHDNTWRHTFGHRVT